MRDGMSNGRSRSSQAHVSVLHWYHQHVIGHHSHTNVEGLDPDLCHFQHIDEAGPGYRLHSKQVTARSSGLPQRGHTTDRGNTPAGSVESRAR